VFRAGLAVAALLGATGLACGHSPSNSAPSPAPASSAQVFSQGFSGGPDAEKDDGAGARGPQEAPILAPRDLNGLWKPGVTPRKRPLTSLDDAFTLEDPPLLPGAREIVGRYHAIRAAGKLAGLSTHACRSPSMYTTLFPAFVIAVVQTADAVFVMFEQPRLVRKIRLNATHQPNLKPSWRGDSVGHWEGNTLLVDTVGFNGLGELDITGAPTSGAAHMIERYTKSADGRAMRLLITIMDPEYLAEPLVVERRWVLSNGVQQGEFDCEENPREDITVDQTVYLESLYSPPCIRVEGKGTEPSRVSCRAESHAPEHKEP
jgi:hypothetical protein